MCVCPPEGSENIRQTERAALRIIYKPLHWPLEVVIKGQRYV